MDEFHLPLAGSKHLIISNRDKDFALGKQQSVPVLVLQTRWKLVLLLWLTSWKHSQDVIFLFWMVIISDPKVSFATENSSKKFEYTSYKIIIWTFNDTKLGNFSCTPMRRGYTINCFSIHNKVWLFEITLSEFSMIFYLWFPYQNIRL